MKMALLSLLGAYGASIFFSLLAFLTLPKDKKPLAGKVLAIIGLGFLVHRFMNDVDSTLKKRGELR